MNKQKELEKIAAEIERCKMCKKAASGKAVPGEGSSNADVVFIGEAPGREEAKTGRPFVGRSGKFLRSLIRKIGLREADVYITSPVKYLPKRGTPTPAAIAHGREHLIRQLKIISPQTVVLLGNVACQGALGETRPVLKDHGSIVSQDGRKYLITIHPAAAVRFKKYRQLIEADFRKLKSLLVA